MRNGMKLVAVSVMVGAIALAAVGTVSAQGPGTGRGRGGMMGGGAFGPGFQAGTQTGGTYGPGMMMGGGAFGPGMMGGFGYDMMDDGASMWTALADLTGLTPAELWQEVADSGSFSAVLEAHDVSVDAATEAILAAHAETLAAAVEAGDLTQEEADAMQVLLSGRIADMLSGTSAMPGLFGGHMWDDDGFGRGWHNPFLDDGTTPDSGTQTVPDATPEVSAS